MAVVALKRHVRLVILVEDRFLEAIGNHYATLIEPLMVVAVGLM